MAGRGKENYIEKQSTRTNDRENCSERDTEENESERKGEICKERYTDKRQGERKAKKKRTRHKTQPCIILSYCTSSSISNECSAVSFTSKINKRCGHHPSSHLIQRFDV